MRTPATLSARAGAAVERILAELEPLAPVDRLRALAAAAIMLGHYDKAAELLARLEQCDKGGPP